MLTVKYLNFLRKRCNINPKRGAIHHRAPSKIFIRTVRGMLPHKTSRGDAALMKLRAVEGVPPPLDKMKRMVIPSALRAVRLNPRRKFCSVGRLSHEVGWKYQNVIETLELKRKAKASLRYAKQKRDDKLRAEAKQVVAAKLKKEAAILESYGYTV